MLSRDLDLYGFTLIAGTVSRYRFTDMPKAAQAAPNPGSGTRESSAAAAGGDRREVAGYRDGIVARLRALDRW
jgi:hypothetical protein